MMNKIYDFSEIGELRTRQNKLIFQYLIYAVCFVLVLILSCVVIENNVVLSLAFATLLFIFILYSVLFWKIKYGLLDEHRRFLDDMETGKQDDYVGVFCHKVEATDESFSTYVFLSSGRERRFLIHNQYPVCFEKGKNYHIVHIGKYVYQWEIID